MKSKPLNFKYLAGISILFRLVILFQIPNLSQDFYRFIWDGRMILEGLNPYLSLPETYIQQGLNPISEALTLYEGMGTLNGSHFTNYPPLHQIGFLIAIRTDVEVEYSYEDCKLNLEWDNALDLFFDLEFDSFIKKVKAGKMYVQK